MTCDLIYSSSCTVLCRAGGSAVRVRCPTHVISIHESNTVKTKQLLHRPRWFQEAEDTRFQVSRHMNAVRSALLTGHLYPLRIYSWYLLLLDTDA